MLNNDPISIILLGSIIGAIVGSTTSVALSKVSENYLTTIYKEKKKKDGKLWAIFNYVFFLTVISVAISGIVFMILFLLIIAFLFTD